jgi:hypothetical protein
MTRLASLVLLLPVLVLAASCSRGDPARAAADLEALRAEVRDLAGSAALRTGTGAVVESDDGAASVIAVGVRVETLREIVSSAASHYLDEVQLHLRLNAVVRAGDDVRVRAGPATVTAGRWDLAVTVQRVDAVLSAGAIEITAADSNRLDLVVPVHVSNATGRALIDFNWDARRLASVVCSDFAIREPFDAYVAAHTQRVRGHFVVTTDNGAMVARPVLRDRIFVSPRPTEQSWERVREILREQDRIFRCGLALSPERMEQMLRELLTQGFRFALPASILRPVPLPGSVLEEIEVAGRRVALAVTPQVPRIAGERLWLRAAVSPTALDDEPIRIDEAMGEAGDRR